MVDELFFDSEIIFYEFSKKKVTKRYEIVELSVHNKSGLEETRIQMRLKCLL